MARSIPPNALAAGAHAGSILMKPERLVGHGFRRAMAGLASGDPCPLEFARQDFANAAGPACADRLTQHLAAFAHAANRAAGRRIETLPAGCPGYCRDECLAISIVAASQHGSCPALRACVYALLESNDLDQTVSAASCLGLGLAEAGQLLSPSSVCNAAALVAPATRVRS